MLERVLNICMGASKNDNLGYSTILVFAERDVNFQKDDFFFPKSSLDMFERVVPEARQSVSVSFYLAGVEFPLRACPNYFGTT
jgi:hypothetical protein